MSKIILAGGSGFIGHRLAAELAGAGHEVVVLTRSPAAWRGDGRAVAWDARGAGPWVEELAGAAAVVNLTGKSVDCRWSAANRRELLDSRVRSVQALNAAMAVHPVPLWIQFSGANFCGGLPGPCGEGGPPGATFLASISVAWEGALAPPPGTRVCVLRPGMVLAAHGGPWRKLHRFTRLGLAARAGSGKQMVSWIHLDDMVAMVHAALADPRWRGPFFACAPEPVTNARFIATMRRACGRPWIPPVPAPVLRLGLWAIGSSAQLVLESCEALPHKALGLGFRFRHAAFAPAIRGLVEAARVGGGG